MYVLYVSVTAVTALLNGYAAFLNVTGADSVQALADRVRVPRTWMMRLGIVLACGATGLLLGFAVPVVGVAAAVGLVLYFVCALGAHLRVGDRKIGGPLVFLLLAATALVTQIGYRGTG